jgi:hypothetical protein
MWKYYKKANNFKNCFHNFKHCPYICSPINWFFAKKASLLKDGAVAQLVEQWTENPCVAGSNPAHTTKKTKNAL